jgi:Fe-Mn family superoxide dismutase
LNAALDKHPELQSKDLEKLLRDINSVPSDSRVAIRNSGGGHANHSLFWTIIGPDGGGSPRGAIADAIKTSFNGFDAFKKAFSKAALDHFGSGWAWVINQNGRLVIETTSNQDSPLMEGKTPLHRGLVERCRLGRYQPGLRTRSRDIRQIGRGRCRRVAEDPAARSA